MESIPVSRGVSTGCLAVMEGAGHSMGLNPSDSKSFPPSMGSPSELRTLPRSPSPTGIPALIPVLATSSQTLISSSLPKSMTPQSSLRISCTMPLSPLAKIRISPYSALSSPFTLAIPSPAPVTYPDLLNLFESLNSSTVVLSMEITSSSAPTFLRMS